MDLFSLLIAVLVFALIFWALNSLIPMDAGAKRIINAVLAVIFALWILSVFFPGFGHLRINP